MDKPIKKKKFFLSVGNILNTRCEIFSNVIIGSVVNQIPFPTRHMIKLQKNEQIIITEKRMFKKGDLRFYRLKLFSINHNAFISISGEKQEMINKFSLYAKA